MALEISVIVCTFNRSRFLEKALSSLLHQTFDRMKFEIIVIDAGSTDDTQDIIRRYSEILQIQFYSVPDIGLSDARNHGIKNARSDILAFLDDDAFADSGWLTQIFYIFQQDRYRICACGGKSLLLHKTPLPSWMTGEMLQILGRLDYGNEGFLMDASRQYPVGLNMAVRKQTFAHIGCFNTRLGRYKGTLLSNEEIEFFRKMRRHNLNIFYDPKMLVYHHVGSGRTTKEFFYNRYYWQGRSDAVMDTGEKPSLFSLGTIIFKTCIKPFRLLKVLFFSRFSSKEQKEVTIRCIVEYHRGYLSLWLPGYGPKS